MKRIRFFSLMFLLLFSACKPEYEGNPVGAPDYDDVLLNGSTIKNNVVTVTAIDSQKLILNFSFTQLAANRMHDDATCYLSGLPAGLAAIPDSGSFILPSEWNPYIVMNIDTGSYIVSLNVQNLKGIQTYPFRIHVVPPAPPLPPPDCSRCLKGTWSSSNNCQNGENCAVVIDTIEGMPHWVSIKNIDCLGDSIVVNAYVSCDSGIIIPKQTTHGYTIYGSWHGVSGVCNYTFITIPDTVIHNTTTTTCTLHLSR